jgi:transposase-like protein
VFTGSGWRRTRRDEDKTRLVAEIATSGHPVCAVTRRHGLSPKQLFGWRLVATSFTRMFPITLGPALEFAPDGAQIEFD